MSVTTHERPGVYSSYDVSSIVSGNNGVKTVGLVAVSSGGTAGEAVTMTRYDAAVAAFGADDAMTARIKLLLLNGAAAVVAVPLASGAGEAAYAAAFAQLNEYEDISIVLCDSTEIATQQALRDAVEAASEERNERIAVVCGGTGETVTQLTARAAELNSERMVLVAPEEGTAGGGALAAAVAGAIAGESDPAVPLGGAALTGLTGLSSKFTESEVDLLIRGGVTPLESVGGEISVIRGVTTRTTTGGEADSTWRELSTILIIDDVIPTIRRSLRANFQRAKNTEQSRGAIRSQVVLLLESKLASEIITGYDNVTAQALTTDATVCVVEFSFTVAHGLNQIWLTAHITV